MSLINDAFRYMEPLINPPSSANLLTPALLKQKAEDEILLLATDETNHEIVGCAFLRIDPNDIYIGKIAVRSSHQRQGITRRFMQKAASIAQSHGLSTLTLETRIELTQNHQAFQQLGFVKTGETAHDGFHPTSITMTKHLKDQKTSNK